jgi:hypothetical protein
MTLMLLVVLMIDNKTGFITPENLTFELVSKEFSGISVMQGKSFTSFCGGNNYLINAFGGYKDWDKQPTTLNYAVEGLSGYLGGAIGAMSTFFLTLPLISDSSNDKSGIILAGGVVGSSVVIGSAVFVSLAGKLMKQEGSFKKAVIGATSVLATGLLLGCIQEQFIISIVAIPIGSVIGYNW